MNKRERLERAIAGDSVDRVPVALWRHWAGDDQRAADLAHAHLDFQMRYDWDFLVIVPSAYFMLTGYGLRDQWRGAVSGQRYIARHLVTHSLEWTDLRSIDAARGDLGKQIQTLQLLSDEPRLDATPLIQVIHSPLTQALHLAGRETLLRHARTNPDRLRTGLNTLTETSLGFIEELRRNTTISGICLVVDTACFTLFSEEEYQTFGLPFALKLLQEGSSDWWLNMIQLTAAAPMLHLFETSGAQVLCWRDVDARPALERVQMPYQGAYCVGLGEITHLNLGTPTMIHDRVREVQLMQNRRRLIIGCGAMLPATTPTSNLRAARQAVENR